MVIALTRSTGGTDFHDAGSAHYASLSDSEMCLTLLPCEAGWLRAEHCDMGGDAGNQRTSQKQNLPPCRGIGGPALPAPAVSTSREAPPERTGHAQEHCGCRFPIVCRMANEKFSMTNSQFRLIPPFAACRAAPCCQSCQGSSVPAPSTLAAGWIWPCKSKTGSRS